ncbi:hypothetical protein BJY01DRAFT_241059 [Aspergillus pseudoustus]|uniref:C2H2-type domain-containing protein n=1 Tax=Aspergillus pseudoustus TaxID=1810923 RepID=A0ABR4IJ93_9EURO
MTERKPAERFPCTFPECKSEFNSVAAMKRHKTLETDHEYCAKCNQDFRSEKQMLIHMIKSKAHIVCPVCGIEFRSEGGRDAHIRQFHRTAQNLICQGCKGTFRSASGLMRHVENGECDNIPKERLRYEQNKRLIAKENLEVASPSRLRIQEGSVLDEDDMDGGVLLGDSLHEQNREAITNQPKHGDSPNEVAKKHWPALKGEDDETGLEDGVKDLMSFTEALAKKEEDRDNEGGSTAWKSEGVQPTSVGTELTYQSQPASASTSSSVVAPTDATSALRRMYKGWKPEMYIDQFAGEYVCPCSKRFRTKRAFEQHILSKNISIRRINCPRCLRLFKSTAAFIAHCESSSTRCDVNEGNMFAQIIEEISGGMIKTAGHNEDGTLRYEAGDVEIQKTVTIGRKW